MARFYCVSKFATRCRCWGSRRLPVLPIQYTALACTGRDDRLSHTLPSSIVSMTDCARSSERALLRSFRRPVPRARPGAFRQSAVARPGRLGHRVHAHPTFPSAHRWQASAVADASISVPCRGDGWQPRGGVAPVVERVGAALPPLTASPPEGGDRPIGSDGADLRTIAPRRRPAACKDGPIRSNPAPCAPPSSTPSLPP